MVLPLNATSVLAYDSLWVECNVYFVGSFPKSKTELFKYLLPPKQPQVKGMLRQYLEMHWALNCLPK